MAATPPSVTSAPQTCISTVKTAFKRYSNGIQNIR